MWVLQLGFGLGLSKRLNYHPILLLPQISKILEKLSQYLVESTIMLQNQFAFKHTIRA